MCDGILKFRSCSTPSRQFWATGLGSYQFVVQGKVYKLSNYNGTNLSDGLTFEQNLTNCTDEALNPQTTGEIPCTSTFTIDSSECFELVEILSTCDYGDESPDNPWALDPLLGFVNGYRIEELYDNCDNCLSPQQNDPSGNPCATTTTSGTSGCGNSNCGCDDGVTACITAPPDCGDDCNDCSCEEVMPSQCVIYNGPRIECLGITPGMSMNQVVALIGSNLCNETILASCSDIECSNNPESCTSPLELVFGPLFDSLSDNNITDPNDVSAAIKTLLDDFWRDGVIQTNDCTNPICCQECCDDSFYFMGGAQLGFAFYELTEYPACCANSSYDTSVAIGGVTNINNENISATLQDLFKLATGRTEVEYISESIVTVSGRDNSRLIFGNTKSCCTDGTFNNCLADLYDAVDNDANIVDAGFIESQYANNTIVCELLEYLNKTWTVTLPNGFQAQFGLTAANKLEILQYFIYSGFVVSCCNGQVFVGGSQSFFELITSGTIAACIQDKVIPRFEIGPFCLDSTPPLPTTTSLEGITGSWVETSVNTSTVGTTEAPLTFVPDPGQNAYSVSVYYQVVEVVANVLNRTACEDSAGAGIATIDLTAENTNIYTNGVTYEWFANAALTVPITDPTAAIIGMNERFQTLYCLVTDQYGCQGTGSITYTPQEVPVFDFTEVGGASYCPLAFEAPNNEGNPVPALPAPTNGVAGAWSPATIDVSVAGVTQYTYTPVNGCEPIIITVHVLNPGDPNSPC